MEAELKVLALVGKQAVETDETVYFDMPNRALNKAGFGLRVRHRRTRSLMAPAAGTKAGLAFDEGVVVANGSSQPQAYSGLQSGPLTARQAEMLPVYF